MPTTPSTQLQFVYSPEHQRVKQVVTGGAQAGTTYYYNGNDSLDLSYEKTIKANGVTEHKHYISLPGSNGQWLLGQFVQRSGNLAANPASSRAAQEFNYFHQDAQGSTVAVSDANGQIQERMAYDPWGDRRNVTGPADPNNLIASEKTDRGYTQHEMLDEVGLVQMNGRIYDPTLGRMLTADILVSYPERSTSFNRYAYALNNPLRFVDPSGWDVLALGPDTVPGYRQQSQAEINSSYDFGLQSSKNGIPLANQGLSLGLKASQPQATISNPSATDAVLHAYDNEYLDGHGYRFVMYANEGIYTNALVEFAGATFNIFDGRRKQAASIVGRGIKADKKGNLAAKMADLKIGEGVKSKNGLILERNGKHKPGSSGYNKDAGTEPSNSLELFDNSVPSPKAPKTTRFAVDANGELHRYFYDNKSKYHWAGSTADTQVPLDVDVIPIEIRRLEGVAKDIRLGKR